MDLNANLHGNWTLENAKARLNQFFQKEKTSAEYKYSQVGPDHNRSESENSVFRAESKYIADYYYLLFYIFSHDERMREEQLL